jgi:RHS repeat-associated protein
MTKIAITNFSLISAPIPKETIIKKLWLILFCALFFTVHAIADEVFHEYDDLGRLVYSSYNDGATITQITFAYDHAGNMTSKQVTLQIPDADQDQIPDGMETQYGLDDNDTDDAGFAPDPDNMTNPEELNGGINPLLFDTNDDVFSALSKIQAGTTHLDPNDYPGSAAVPSTGKKAVTLLCLLLSGLGLGFLFRPNGTMTVLLVCGLMVLTAGGTGYAQPANPGWLESQGEQVTPQTAKTYYQSLKVLQAKTLATATKTLSAGSSDSPEITELARGLQYDPKLIFEYVRNHVDYVPYFGSLKGSVLTYLDGSGNDFDQASLLIDLLYASGYNAQYVYGTMQIPYYGATDQKDMQHWLGVDANTAVIHNVLANGGIPAVQAGSFCQLNRVWVSANINGTTYLFDPAFKAYQETHGINLATAMGYNQATLLAAAGGTMGTDYIQNLNESGLRSLLNNYSGNLFDHIRETYPNAGMEEIIGGRKIIPEYLSALPTDVEFTNTVESHWNTIPTTYVHTLRIQHGEIDETLNIPDLAGKRLSVTYDQPLTTETAAMRSAAQKAALKPMPNKTAVQLPDMNVPGPQIKSTQRAAVSTKAASTWNFGRIPASAYNQGTLNMTNSNSVTIRLVISLTSNPQNAYSIVSGGGTTNVPAGASHAISVRFNGSGQTPGTKTGQLKIAWWYGSNNFANTIYNLTGVVAQAPDLTGSYGRNFGQAYFNSPAQGVCRIKNSGTLNISLTSIGLNGTDTDRFELTSGAGTGAIAPGQYRDIHVNYLADTVGSHNASVLVRFTYDGVTQGINLPLTGETLSPPVAQLWLDDTLVAQETAPVSGANLDKMFLTIDHPYSGDSGTFSDQAVEYPMKRGAFYTIIYDFGGSRDGRLLEKRQKEMMAYRRSGVSDTSREVLTETLNVIGMTWMRDTTLNDNLLAQIANVLSIRHHRFGVMAQEEGYYIDVKAQQSASVSKNNDAAAIKAYFKAVNHLASALEHGVLEQMQVDRPAVSTTKLLQLTNEDGDKIFQVTSANYASIEPQLFNYSDADKQTFQQSVNAGNTLILPANGQISLQQWGGKGYIDYYIGTTDMHCGMIIGGDYFGGKSVTEAPIQISPVNKISTVNATADANEPKVPNGDPVDMTSGHFMHDNVDLALSGGMGGLAFKRSYFGGNHHADNGMGYGWSHNYRIFAEPYSSSKLGLGSRLPTDAVALIAASVVTLDLMTGNSGLQEWMAASLTGKWGMDKLTDNVVSIHLETDVLTYVKLPDGSFALPPGVNAALVMDNGLYRLEDRFDLTVQFNADNQAETIVDADGNTLTFTYATDRVSAVSDDFGHSLTFGYSGDHLTSITDSAGRSVGYTYTGNDLTAYTDPENKTWEYGYDDDHRLTTLINPELITTVTNAYDSLGRVMAQTVPRQTGTTTYNLYYTGFCSIEEDSQGAQTLFYYDPKKRLIATENALGEKSLQAYDAQNHVIEATDPKGNITTFDYDGDNNLVKVTNALTQETLSTYDDQFRLTMTTDPLGHAVQYGYDTEHHLTQTTIQPDPGVLISTANTFYANGQVHTTTDGRGIVTNFTYDTWGNPDTTQTATAPAIDYQYDGTGRLTQLTDQENSTTGFTYDNRGQLLTKTDPLMNTMTLTYFDDGKVQSITDRNNDTVSYAYTPSGKIDTVTLPDSTTAYTYDQKDNLTQMQDRLGTTTYTYDAVRRLTSKTDANGFGISYTYDENGNLATLTYPGNKTVTYTYDALNRLHTVTDWLDRTATYTYDAAGRLTSLTQFNGTVVQYSFDNANRLTGLENLTAPSGSAIATYQFTLDNNGNRTDVNQQVPISPDLAALSTTFTTSTAGNRLVQAGSNTFTYDDQGQLTSAYGNTLTFDPEHRLTAIGTTSEFKYDGTGARLEATRSSVTTRYIYDAAGNLLAEADAANQIQRYYIYGAGLLAMAEPAGALYCYHFDATGHTVALTNISKAIVNKYAYSPFGTIANQEETVAQPFKFVGQYGVMTEDNGWYYMRARYYDPEVGRFISEDPLGFDGGDVNLYAYTSNNPVMFSDPLGLWSFWYGGTGVMALGKEGINVSTGFSWDSESGDGLYFSAGKTEGIAGSIGGEVGVYTGSISGKTTVATLGISKFSIGLVVGSGDNIFGFNVGIVIGASAGLPIETSISHNTTWATGSSNATSGSTACLK